MLKKFLKRIPFVEMAYISFKGTPTFNDGCTYFLYRLLIQMVDLTRFFKKTNVFINVISRKLIFTFKLRHPNGRVLTISLPVSPLTYGVWYEVFHEQVYSPQKALSPEVIVDLGANIGLVTVYLHGLFPNARFVCVEPDPSNLKLLERNLSQNGVKYDVVASAITGIDGDVEFLVNKAHSECNSVNSSKFIPEEAMIKIKVSSVTLGTILTSFDIEKVGILKIDIEGSEFQVLDSKNPALNCVEYIMGEFHLFAGDPDALIKGLSKDYGFSLALINDKKNRKTLPVVHLAK